MTSYVAGAPRLVPFDAATIEAVHQEIRDLARWLQLDPVLPAAG